MAAFLFAGSSMSEIPLGSTGDNVQAYTSGGSMDSNYTLRACDVDAGIRSTDFDVPLGGPFEDVWFHVRWAPVSAVSQPMGEPVVFEAGGTKVASLLRVSTNQPFFLRAFGDSTVTSASGYAMPTASGAASTRTFDFNVKSRDDTVTITGFVDSVEFGSVSTSLDGAAGIDRIKFGNFVDYYRSVFSECIISDGLPTLGMRLSQHLPADDGFYTDMQGDWTDLVSDDPMRAVVGTADGQRQSWKKTAYSGPLSPTSIAAVVTGISAKRLLGTPTKVNQFLRIDGSDFDAGKMSTTNLSSRRQDVWWVNPKTGLPWVTQDFIDAEIGFRVTD